MHQLHSHQIAIRNDCSAGPEQQQRAVVCIRTNSIRSQLAPAGLLARFLIEIEATLMHSLLYWMQLHLSIWLSVNLPTLMFR